MNGKDLVSPEQLTYVLVALVVAGVALGLLVVIAGGLVPPYQVKPNPNWATDVPVTNETAAGFLLTFTTPAPVDAEVDLTIFQDDMGMRCR